MPFVALQYLLPEIAKSETRVLTVRPGANIPLTPGEYWFCEMFCDEKDCDCRRAFFTVFSLASEKTEALIAWGWETASFYKHWIGCDNPKMILDLQGPILDLASPISRNAKVLLEFFAKVLLADTVYVERVKKHYAQFRAIIDSSKTPKSVRPISGVAVAGNWMSGDGVRESSVATSARSDRHGAGLTRTRQQSETQQHVGRNDSCPCGSGKKFKKCCLR